jgi:hypothetical protein
MKRTSAVLVSVFFSMVLSPSHAWSARQCVKPQKQAVFCVDSGGCSDSVEIVQCPNWGQLQEAQRCSSGWDSQVVRCCGNTYNSPRIANCQVIEVRSDGHPAPARAACLDVLSIGGSPIGSPRGAAIKPSGAAR